MMWNALAALAELPLPPEQGALPSRLARGELDAQV